MVSHMRDFICGGTQPLSKTPYSSGFPLSLSERRADQIPRFLARYTPPANILLVRTTTDHPSAWNLGESFGPARCPLNLAQTLHC